MSALGQGVSTRLVSSAKLAYSSHVISNLPTGKACPIGAYLTSRDALGLLQARDHSLTQAGEVLGIPRIENLRIGLQGATRDQRIVCHATRDSICGCALEDREVFNLIECWYSRVAAGPTYCGLAPTKATPNTG